MAPLTNCFGFCQINQSNLLEVPLKDGYLYQVEDEVTITQDVFMIYSRDFSRNDAVKSSIIFIDSLAI